MIAGLKKENINEGRLAIYDIGKGIAIYLVVLGHLLGQTFNVGQQLQNIITFVHLPVFFFISGFFYINSINRYSKKKLLLNKIRQLLIPYLFWSCVSFFTNVIFRITDSTIIDIVREEFVQIFIYSRSVWFLVVLFITQCIVVGMVWLSEMFHINKYLVVIIGWILISVCTPNVYFSMWLFKWLFPFFIIGIFYAENKKKLESIRKVCVVSVVFPILYIIMFDPIYFKIYLEFDYDGLKSMLIGGGYYIISLFGVSLVLLVSFYIQKLKFGRWIAEMGKYSMEVYVMHMIFIKFLVYIPAKMYENESIFTYLYIIISSAVIIGMIVLLAKYLNKFKVFRIIMGKNPTK